MAMRAGRRRHGRARGTSSRGRGGRAIPISTGHAPAFRRRMRMNDAAVSHEAPSTGVLFRGFLTLGLMGFGGVLPLARRMVVEDRQWMSAAEFADLLGLCQFLPG